MNETEQDFEALRRLLALKRHEVPPPGYFNNFSQQVVSRIRTETSAKPQTVMDRLFAEAPWLLSILGVFKAKPAFTGVFASAACLLIVSGIVYTENPDAGKDAALPMQFSQLSPGAQEAATAQNDSSVQSMSPAFLNAAATPVSLDSSNLPMSSLQPVVAPAGGPSQFFRTADLVH